ncbi:MAG: RNA polymerase sigma factor [Sedimentitalea sp.]|uniref:RNA polymerase sigma factor n=1 Tax=Sedimentitalea sp. TaxID=2048915 RepID=UPI00326793C9
MDETGRIRQIGSGDKHAMRDLYVEHGDAIYAFVLGRCGDPALARDTVQDTMLDVWRTASRFSGNSSVKTWLFAIARNKLVDALRKRGKLSFVEEVPDSVDQAPNPEAAAIASAESSRLRQCLDRLSNTQRTAVRLAFFEDLTYAEIGEIESVPTGTIKTRIFHAKQALMRCLSRG